MAEHLSYGRRAEGERRLRKFRHRYDDDGHNPFGMGGFPEGTCTILFPLRAWARVDKGIISRRPEGLGKIRKARSLYI